MPLCGAGYTPLCGACCTPLRGACCMPLCGVRFAPLCVACWMPLWHRLHAALRRGLHAARRRMLHAALRRRPAVRAARRSALWTAGPSAARATRRSAARAAHRCAARAACRSAAWSACRSAVRLCGALSTMSQKPVAFTKHLCARCCAPASASTRASASAWAAASVAPLPRSVWATGGRNFLSGPGARGQCLTSEPAAQTMTRTHAGRGRRNACSAYRRARGPHCYARAALQCPGRTSMPEPRCYVRARCNLAPLPESKCLAEGPGRKGDILKSNGPQHVLQINNILLLRRYSASRRHADCLEPTSIKRSSLRQTLHDLRRYAWWIQTLRALSSIAHGCLTIRMCPKQSAWRAARV